MAIEEQTDDKTFWCQFRTSLLDSVDDNYADRSALTPARLASPERLHAMTDAEISWMLKKLRAKRKIRVYRAAPQPQMIAFRWHTSQAQALGEIHGEGAAVFVVGEVDPKRVMMRIETGGRKQILCLPEAVKPIKVTQLTLEEAA